MAKTLKDIIPAFKKSPYGDYTVDVHSPDKEKVDTVTKKADNHKDKKLTKEEVLEMLENYDQLDELSKKTLGNYIKGAVKDVHKTSGSMAKTAGSLDKDESKKYDKSFNKNYKRHRGISAATNRLTKEDILEMIENYDQLDELSKKTLASYVKKASTDARDKGVSVGTAASTGNGNEAKHEWKGSNKRLKGISKATDRLTKEDVELDQLDEGYAEQQVDYTRRAITQAQTIAQYLERLADMAQASAEHQAGVQDGSIDPKQVVAPRSPYFEAKNFSRQLEDMADSLENSIDQMDRKY